MQEFRKVHQYNVFCVNTPMQEALSIYLQNENKYSSLGDFYFEKKIIFEEGMNETAFKALPCQGTYFQLYSYENISLENDVVFAKELILKNKVAAIPLSVFYHDKKDQKLLRFCFAKKESTLKNAIAQLKNI